MNELVPSSTMLSPQQAFPFQKEIATWNVENAIQQLQPKVTQFKRVSVDVARELWIAHAALAQRGGDRRSEDAVTFGFGDFLAAVGISKKTAYLWLKLYDPASDRVRDPEELAPLKSANPTVPAEELGEFERLVAHAMATGDRLDGWTDAHEREYKKRRENERFAEMARRWGTKKVRTNWGNDDYFAITVLKDKNYAKFNLQTKEQYSAQLEVFDMLNGYLKSFDDPATRLAAVCNIGLRVRSLVNEMAESERELSQFSGVGI